MTNNKIFNFCLTNQFSQKPSCNYNQCVVLYTLYLIQIMQTGSRDLSKSLDIALHPTLKAWLWIRQIKRNSRKCIGIANQIQSDKYSQLHPIRQLQPIKSIQIGIANQIEVLHSYNQSNPIKRRFWIAITNQIQSDCYSQSNPIKQRFWIVTANQIQSNNGSRQLQPIKSNLHKIQRMLAYNI